MMDGARAFPWWVGGLLGLSIGLSVLNVFLLAKGPNPARSDGEVSTSRVDTLYIAQQATNDDLSAGRLGAIERAARNVSPSVVSVHTIKTLNDASHWFTPSEIDRFGRHNRQTTSVASGSGIIVDHRGYVLTSAHVIEASTELQIALADGQTFDAEIIGASPEHDLAVIKIVGTVSGLPTVPLGDSDKLRNGEWAIALGSPFGHLVEDNQPTVTVGVISATNREIRNSAEPVMGYAPDGGHRSLMESRQYWGMIQTDATINPGNSGGPLVNAMGEVIGINTTAITSSDGGSTGLSFAVPINRAKWVLEELLEHGRVRSVNFGITGWSLTRENRNYLHISDKVPAGWLIERVVEGSAAVDTNLQPGDVLTHLNGQSIADSSTQYRLIKRLRVGEVVTLSVWRNGEVFDVSMTLGESGVGSTESDE